MIKTFEQFVSDKYGSPINEAYQSSKLREIIKQHGKPKRDEELKMLYDIKDNEIIDVVNDRDEYWEKYPNKPKDDRTKEQATFMIELEDGACVVIGNLDILKRYYDESGMLADMDKRSVFKKRHSERHVGNLGKHGELDIRRTHRKNLDKLEAKRHAENLRPYIDEIVDEVMSLMDSIDTNELDNTKFGQHDRDIESELILGDEKYNLYIGYSYSYPNYEEYDESHLLCYSLEYFEIEDKDEVFMTNDVLGITPKTHKDLFKEYRVTLDGYMDLYKYNGVSRSDFF